MPILTMKQIAFFPKLKKNLIKLKMYERNRTQIVSVCYCTTTQFVMF